MRGYPNGRRKGLAGLPDAPLLRALRMAVDFILLVFFVLLAQVSAAYGVAAAEDAGLLMYPDALSPAGSGESLRLENGAEARAARVALSRFSQIDEAVAGGRGRFYLPTATGGAAPAPAASAAPLPPRYTTTAQFGGPFLAARAKVADAILAAPEADRIARNLDYAQFLIARMMLPEARGVIRALAARPEAMDAESLDRAAGYAAIIARLAGGATGDLPAAWADDPLWPAIVAGRPLPAADLTAAVASLSGHSREVATAVLPLLFDLALGAGETGMAAEILASAPAGTDLDGTGLLDLMRGRLALAQGAEDLAFDTFARVAEGQDRATAEARIALADMALSRKDPALLPQVSRLLQDGLLRWRGDATALRLRVRLARVAEDMGDLTTAVEVMSMILHEHPATPEAELAEARTALMVGRLAQRIAADLPLADAVASVRRLDGALSARGDWVAARAALARRLADAGLFEAARAEHAAIAQMPDATLAAADPAVVDGLTVDRARLLLDAGAEAKALAVLDRRTYPRRPDHMAEHAALRLRAGRTAVLPGLLLAALQVDAADQFDDPAVQLALADVAMLTGQTDAALAALDRGIGHADQTRRLRASTLAGQAGDAARTTRFAAGLEGERADLRRAALQNLAAPRLSGQRLSVSGASALITAAETAGASVDALLAKEATP